MGTSDLPRVGTVKLYCCQCEDIYNPKSSVHGSVDGAFFGTTFPHLFLMTYPSLKSDLGNAPLERYKGRIFGFAIHAGDQ